MIELDGVSKTYMVGKIQVAALKEVRLSIAAGEHVAIMGASGSGKSTMMNIMGCLDTPTSGQYSLDGEDVGQLNDNQLATIRYDKIGFVFQSYNLLPRLTALGNVELPLLYGRTNKRKQRSMEALERVGLAHRAHHRPSELSGGEQQRVGIARALAKNPTLLLADEPTGNLDSQSSSEIMEILMALNTNENITIIMVTHENDIAAHAQRIVSMMDGMVFSDLPAKASQGK
jgi:putative ABC transport system ATP-binding protein